MSLRQTLAALALALAPLMAQSAAQSAAPSAPDARVTYTRSFKGSQPAFFQIEVRQDGRAQYQGREVDADPQVTLAFTASPAAVEQIFSAAARLDEFAGPRLQSKDKVAYTGDKMLAFDDGSRHASQEFTYTKLPAASALVALFEKISVTGMDAIRLRRAVQYQPLDVLDAMNQIQSDWDSHQMAEPQLLEPVLQAAVANPAVMDAARHRAQKLLDAFAKSRK